jgi:ribosomal-protein-alanine N-acetyltransferase
LKNQLTILRTKRLRLKHLEVSDLSALVDLWCDPEVTQYMGGPRDREKLKTILDEELQNPFAECYNLWTVEEVATGDVVGDCGLLEKEVEGVPEIEVVYVFAKGAWGKGYATEIGTALVRHGFDELGLSRLIALIDPENQPSERVAMKMGMICEKEVIRPGGALRKVYVIER